MTHHFVMTSSLRIKILKIEKFGDFSCDIDYNSRTGVFRDVNSLIINQCGPWRPKSVRQPRSASKRSALIYICILTIKTRLMCIYIYKRASLACAARLADTLCPPDTPFRRLCSPLINYKGNNISKYVCPTVIIDIARKITKFINF